MKWVYAVAQFMTQLWYAWKEPPYHPTPMRDHEYWIRRHYREVDRSEGWRQP